MELSPTGRKLTCFCVLVALAVKVCDSNLAVDISVAADVYTEAIAEDDYSVRGDIFIIHTRLTDISDNVQLMLYQSMLANGRVILKLSGNAISIVNDVSTLHSILHHTSKHLDFDTDVARDILDVVHLCERKCHLYVIIDTAMALTEASETLATVIKDLPIRLDVIIVADKSTPDTRHRRQINFYQLLANISGGSVITTDKNNIGSAVDVIKQSIQTGMVTLMKFNTRDTPGKTFRVSMDDTMSEMVAQVQVENYAPVMIAQLPAGTPCPSRPRTLGSASAGSVLSIIEYNLTQPTDYGAWKFTKLDSYTWDMTIKGHSPVDFTHQFVEPGVGGYGQYPIKGRPIAGTTYKLIITVPQYSKVADIKALFLMSRDKFTPIGFGSLTNVGGRRGKSMFHSSIAIPTQVFMIAIEGRDKSGHTFRRLDPMLITPSGLELDVPSMAGAKLYVNETLRIPFTVTNEGGVDQDVDVRIEDDRQFARAPAILSYTLRPGENVSGVFTIHGGNVIGVTTTVTITAKPYIPGVFSQGQYHVRRFTVVERPKKIDDKIDPTCNITAVTGACNIGSDLCACSKHTWSMDLEVGDVGDGIRELFPAGAGTNTSYTFTHDNFTKGHNNSLGLVKASFSASCCQQMATIQVVDMAGNTGQCQANITQNFTPPDPKLCNNSTLNVTIPCKNIQKTGSCNFGTNPCDCDTMGWHMQAEFDTVGWNITQAFTKGAGNNGSLVRNMNKVELDSDCCHQQIIIDATDVAGNIGQCNVSLSNFQTPTPGQCTTTVSTTTLTTTPTSTSTSTTAKSTTARVSSVSSPGTSASVSAAQTSTKAMSASSSPVAVVSTSIPKSTSGSGNSVASGSSTVAKVTTGSPVVSAGSSASAVPLASSTAPGIASNKQATTTIPAITATVQPLNAKTTSISGGSSVTSAGAPKREESDSSDNGITATSVGVGMAFAAVFGITAIAAMGAIFWRALGRATKSVKPRDEDDDTETIDRNRRMSNLAWS